MTHALTGLDLRFDLPAAPLRPATAPTARAGEAR